MRPGKCQPLETTAEDIVPDVAEYANYAEANGIVVLHPCMGGAVDKSFTHAPDVVAGSMDVYEPLFCFPPVSFFLLGVYTFNSYAAAA